MNWFKKWFQKGSTQAFLKAALSILKIFLGEMANEIWKRVTESVARAEQTQLNGPEKAKLVLDDMKKQWPGIKNYIANLVLELAVAFYKEGLLKK